MELKKHKSVQEPLSSIEDEKERFYKEISAKVFSNPSLYSEENPESLSVDQLNEQFYSALEFHEKSKKEEVKKEAPPVVNK